MFKGILAFCFYSAIYFLLIFYPGLIRIDDFGYLQGVVESLAQGRILTHEWLGPYSIPLTALSCLAYLATGNFMLSTWGLQASFVLINFILIYRLIRYRLDDRESALLTLAITSLPFYLHKCSEYGGTVLTLTFVLLAFWAYKFERWIWFFLTAFLAFANRQNSIALLTIPIFLSLFGKDLQLQLKLPIGLQWRSRKVWVVGMGIYGVAALYLHHSMNVTFAQNFALYVKMDRFKLQAIAATEIYGVLVAIAILSGLGLLMGSNLRKNLANNFRNPWAPLILTMSLGLIAVVGSMPYISFLTPLVGSIDKSFFLQKLLLIIIPVLFWTLDYKMLKFDAAFCMLIAYVLISGLRGFWYDFYLIDIGLAALILLVLRGGPVSDMAWVRVATVILIAGNLTWAYAYKIFSDKQMHSVYTYERMERKGKISVERMTDATYAYLGWKLLDYHIQQKKINSMDEFLNYVRRDQIGIETHVPWRHKFKTQVAPENILEKGPITLGYFPLKYQVIDRYRPDTISICGIKPLNIDRKVFQIKPFPLNSKEWTEWVDKRKEEENLKRSH